MSESRSRRAFLQATTAARPPARRLQPTAAPRASRAAAPSSFLPIVRPPDRVFAQVEGERLILERSASGAWARAGVRVETSPGTARLAVRVASDVPLRRVELRWARVRPAGRAPAGRPLGAGLRRSRVARRRARAADALVLPRPRRPRTHGYGVRTGAGALAHWQRGRRGREPLARRPLRRPRRRARRPHARGGDRRRARGRATASRPSPPPGPSAPSCTKRPRLPPRPSTAATAGTAPTTASTRTSSVR